MGATRTHHTILVVEDDEMLLDLLCSLFEASNFNVLRARDGEEAVELFRNNHPSIHLVLTDMGLPKLSGWEVFEQMKQIDPNVKVIIASGFMNTHVKREMMEAGAKDFVQKPYVPGLIVETVQRILAQP